MPSEDLKGLSQKEASEILQKEGYNELPSSKPKSVFKIAFGVVKEPMFLLLVACGTLYLITWRFTGRINASQFCICDNGDRVLSGEKN